MTEPLKFYRRSPEQTKPKNDFATGETKIGGIVIGIEDLGKRRDAKFHEIIDELLKRDLARTNPVLSIRRRKRNEIMEDLEERWWWAHESGVKESQRTIEEEIGRRLGLRRGGNFIYRLRIAADIYENLDKNPSGNMPIPFPAKPRSTE